MLEERLTPELSENVDRMDTRVNKIAEDKIDNPVFASERHGRLCTFPREWVQPGSLSTSEDDTE